MDTKDVARAQPFDVIDNFVIRHYNPRLSYGLNDDELEAVWKILNEEIGAQKVFYDMQMNTFDQFRELFDWDGACIPLGCVFRDGLLMGCNWINNYGGRSARSHFFCTKAARLMGHTVGCGKAMTKYWSRMKDVNTGEPILQSLVGITPASYKLAVKYLQKVGYVVLGVVKGGVYMFHENKVDDAVVSTIDLDTIRE